MVFGLVFSLMAASLGIVGALIVTQRAGNAVGWILLAASVSIAVATAASDYGRLVTASGDWLPGRVIAAWAFEFALPPAILWVIILVPLLFPDGRLLSPRWRWAAAYGLAVVALVIARDMFAPGPLNDFPAIMNPAGIEGFSMFGAVFDFANGPGVLLAALLGIASSVLRYRRGTVVERTQLRWFGAATALTLLLFSLVVIFGDGPIAEFGWVGGILALCLIPVAIGIAILRYRLYEIDRIDQPNAGLGDRDRAPGGRVRWRGSSVLQAVLAPFTKENTLAVAGSTLVAFALFQPIRRRVQRAVDRRFDRARYDGQRTVDAFAEHLRSDVDLGSLRSSLAATANRAVRPATASVWLSPRTTR